MQVKVKVKAGQAVQFPGECVYCGNPAGAKLTLRKRIGRVSRHIALPLCQDCAQELSRFSGEEERWRTLSWLVAGLIWLGLTFLGAVLLPADLLLGLRLLLVLVPAGIIANAIRQNIQHNSLKRARPEKQEILNAAKIVTFSWRTTTFDFANETFAAKVMALNQLY